jgi:integrase
MKGGPVGVKVREKVKGSGVFWVFINHQGKRTSKQVGGEKAALKVKDIIDARLRLGQSFLPEEKPVPSVPTLNEYYQRFKNGYMETAGTESTRDSYELSFRVHILPELGSLRMDEVGREEVQEFIAALVKKDLAKDSVRLASVIQPGQRE